MSFSEAYMIQTEKDMVLYSSEMMHRYGIVNFFPARTGGVSEGAYASLNFTSSTGDSKEKVEKNIRHLIESTGGKLDRTVRTKQIHGKIIRRVGSSDGGVGICGERSVPACDGLFTDIQDMTLMVSSADCPNILVYAPDKGMIGAAHAGWRGTAMDIAGELIEKMREAGCNPGKMTAFLPPAIGACCFDTDEDVPTALLKAYGEEIRMYIREVSPGRCRIDLQRINAQSMVWHGLCAERIVVCPICTCCHTDFYSHRRSGPIRGLGASIIRMPL